METRRLDCNVEFSLACATLSKLYFCSFGVLFIEANTEGEMREKVVLVVRFECTPPSTCRPSELSKRFFAQIIFHVRRVLACQGSSISYKCNPFIPRTLALFYSIPSLSTRCLNFSETKSVTNMLHAYNVIAIEARETRAQALGLRCLFWLLIPSLGPNHRTCYHQALKRVYTARLQSNLLF